MPNILRWVPALEIKLREYYPQTESREGLLEAFPGFTWRAIQHHAAKLGLRKPRLSNAYLKHNEHLFDTWTEESAYILGYLEADGCIRHESRACRVIFACSEKDAKYLALLKKIVGFTGKTYIGRHLLSNGKIYRSHKFVVSSRVWKEFLREHLRIGHIPEDIPVDLLHHYIRGYFDGDGSFYIENQSGHLRANIVSSSRSLIEEMAEILRPVTDAKMTIHTKTNSASCWYVSTGASQAIKLGAWIYSGASLFLDRKKSIWQAETSMITGT